MAKPVDNVSGKWGIVKILETVLHRTRILLHYKKVVGLIAVTVFLRTGLF